MKEIWLEAQGADGLYAIFHEEEGAGYFFVYKPEAKEVLSQIQIYKKGESLSIQGTDVQVMWSANKKSCGVAVCGEMRGIIEVESGERKCAPFSSPTEAGIVDNESLRNFKMFLSKHEFIRARQRYWQAMVKQHENMEAVLQQEMPIDTGFICYEGAEGDWFGVFEDDGETGYLYIYKPGTGEILRHLHLYDRSAAVDVKEEDVAVLWSDDLNKCGVVIWGKMRGIIDLKSGQEGRVWLENRQTPGIGDRDWLAGFEV